MRKIAIVAGTEIDDDYNVRFIAQHIGEWTEVSEVELESAMEGLHTVNRVNYGKYGVAKYRIIEFPEQGPLVSELIAAGRATKEEKLKKLKQLRDELGVEIKM